MARSADLAAMFQQPTLVSQRNYEICKAYYGEEISASELARRFGLQVDTIREIVAAFAKDPNLEQFFHVKKPGPASAAKQHALSEEVLRLRREGLTLQEICSRLTDPNQAISQSTVYRILTRHGLAGRGLRQSSHRVRQAKDGSDIPPQASVTACLASLLPDRKYRFDTKVAGLFLFTPLLLALDLPNAVVQAGWPGSEVIPPLQAILALLSGKLLGQRRISHIDDLSNDEGAGLFAGLNVLPKSTFATDYSYRTERPMSDRFLNALLSKTPVGQGPRHFNLDFHVVPYRGEKADLQKHWLSKNNRAGTSVMMFAAQHRESRMMCYATANVVRDDMDAMAVRFADHQKVQTGNYPELVLMDSRVTTYENLAELEKRQIGFITIRRRGKAMLKRVEQLREHDWKSCRISRAKGGKTTIRYVDEEVKLDGYEPKMRQLIVRGLGRESPTFFLTNDRPVKRTAREIVEQYARRNQLENSLGEQITFFHLDCLSSGVRLNVDFDLTLTVAADLLYRTLASKFKGFEHASPQTLFRKFIDITGSIEIAQETIRVRLSKRAHNPLIREAGLCHLTSPIPWLNQRRLLLELP